MQRRRLSALSKFLGADLERLHNGCYRFTLGGRDNRVFGQITRHADHGVYWVIELRATETGALIRNAGSYPTLRAASDAAYAEVAGENGQAWR